MNDFIIRAVPARLAVLLVCALVIAFAASCGGKGDEKGDEKGKPTPTPAGLELPADLSDEQKAAILQIPNLADETEPLATFVSQKALPEDEMRATIEGDAQFVELEALAKSAGFGPATAGVELQYDNGIKVTAAVLDSPEGGLALAMRETGSTPVYVVLHLASDGRTVTEYNSEGTITLDIETLKGSEVDAPDAHHSCRTGHCIWAALTWLSDTWYGEIVAHICGACIEAVAAEIVTAGASTVIAIPACIVCIPALAAAGIAPAIVCYDAPCSYCMDNTCGDPAMSHDVYCARGVGPSDPNTGISASVTNADTGYECVGITKELFGGDDLSESECEYSSKPTGIVRPCPYGCAEVAPGDTESRDCASICNSATCNSEEEKGDPYCVHVAPPDKDVIKRAYDVQRCVDTPDGGSTCQWKTEAREIAECDFGCADSLHCAQPTPSPESSGCGPATCPSERPVDDPVCTTNPGGRTSQVTQHYEQCACRPVQGEPGESTCECVPEALPKVTVCTEGCADGRSCAAPGERR